MKKTKKELRQYYLNYRENMGQRKIEETSSVIARRLFKFSVVREAKAVMCFHSFRNEVITHQIIENLLEKGKTVYLPYILTGSKELRISPVKDLNKDIAKGFFSVMEPVNKLDSSIELLDIIIVPGLLFTRSGYRLGYGGGYYDRLLSKIDKKTKTIGLVFHSLLVDKLPLEKYDLPVDIIITEEEVIYT